MLKMLKLRIWSLKSNQMIQEWSQNILNLSWSKNLKKIMKQVSMKFQKEKMWVNCVKIYKQFQNKIQEKKKLRLI